MSSQPPLVRSQPSIGGKAWVTVNQWGRKCGERASHGSGGGHAEKSEDKPAVTSASVSPVSGHNGPQSTDFSLDLL